ncbi:MAG: hypothetical protein LBJ72_11730, partial [Dysgonamonadaceae bacterium]|nr:hypothetical protein [Dysgonamonadaceae bacterium]
MSQIILSRFILLLVLLYGVAMKVQSAVSWETNYPRWETGQETLTVEGEAGKLELFLFTPEAIADAGFEFTLPLNLSCTGVESLNSISYGAPTVSGQTVTIKITSNGGTIAAGSQLRLKLSLRAACGAVSAANAIQIKLLSGTAPVPGSDKTVNLQVQSPVIQMTTLSSTVSYTGKDTYEALTYELKSDIPVGTYKIILTVDQSVSLRNFLFDGSTVTENVANIANNERTYTLSLTGLSTVEKALTFEGASSLGGSHVITPKVQYPAAQNCLTGSGSLITMLIPATSGLPNMTSISVNYVDTDKTAVINRNDVIVDGLTRTWARFVFENTGTADACYITATISAQGRSTYIEDIDEIYYSVDGDLYTKIPTTWLTVNSTVVNYPSRTFLPSALGKPYHVGVTFPLDFQLGINHTITLLFPTINGKIYDSAAPGYVGDDTHQFMSVIAAVYSKNDSNIPGITSNVLDLHWNDITLFNEMPSPFSVKQSQSIVREIKTYRGVSKFKLYLQLPSWLKLDTSGGDPLVYTNSGESYAPVENESNLTADPPYKIYTTDGWAADDKIILKFKADPFPPTESNKEGTISYWMDYDFNGQILEKIGYITQQVTLLCKEEGVALEDVSFHRITRGLKDSDNNYLPDALASPAPDVEISHDSYLSGDQGEFRVRAKIVNGSSWNYLYLPVEVADNSVSIGNSGTYQLYIRPEQIRLRRNGVDENLPVTMTQNGKSFYLRVNASGNPLTGNQILDIVLPFSVNAGYNQNKVPLDFKCCVSNDPLNPVDPATATDREGTDCLSKYINLWIPGYAITGTGAITVPSTNERKFYLYMTNSFTNGIAPYFPKEVRRGQRYGFQMKFTLPNGYRLYDDKIVVGRGSLDTQGPATKELLPENITGNVYTYDWSSLYNLDMNSDEGSLASNDWALPDDYMSQTIRLAMQATKGVTSGASVVRVDSYLKNHLSGQETIITTTSHNINYYGLSSELVVSQNSLSSMGSSLTLPVLKVGNPNSSSLDRIWLYVDGNVSDLTLTPLEAGASVSGSGSNNRWLEITTTGLAGGSNLNYSLNFKHLGRTDGKDLNDTIKIYFVSNFEDGSFLDPTGAVLDKDDYDHIGVYRSVEIVSLNGRVDGNISVSNTVLGYNTPYTLTASINGTGSPGILRNPQMIVTAPAGQEYIPNSLSLSYKGVTYSGTPLSSLESVLTSDNSDPATERTFVIDLKTILGADVLFPGYLSTDPGDTDLLRQATLTASFKPMCETNLTGIYFKGEITAENITETRIKLSNILLPSITNNYLFQVSSGIKDGNRGFNEMRTDAVCVVTLRKLMGQGDDMDLNDRLQLIIPQQFDINGSASIISGLGIGTVNVESNTVIVGNKREIKFSLPVSDYGAAPDKGVGVDVVYEIPLRYSPNGQALAGNPEQVIDIAVVTNKSFDASCPPSSASIGSGQLEVAVVTASENTAYACLNTEKTLSITSLDFEGSWYDDAAKTNPALSAIATHGYTPTVQASGGRTFFVSAKFGATEYGMVPISVTMNPEATVTVDPLTVCAGTSVDLTSLISETPVEATIEYFGSDQETPVSSPTSVLVNTSTTYYVQVTTTAGCKSAKTPVVVTVNPLPQFTLSKTSERI